MCTAQAEWIYHTIEKAFGASEENHIIKSCYDTECDNIDIQPWRACDNDNGSNQA